MCEMPSSPLSQQKEGPRLVPDNALSGGLSWAELSRGPTVGIIPGILPGNVEGKRDTAMAELPKMSVEELSQHL
jgi:hypothetical protein